MRVKIINGDSVLTVERFPEKTKLLGLDVREENESGKKHFFNVLDLAEDWVCGKETYVSVGGFEIILRPICFEFDGAAQIEETYAGLKILEIEKGDFSITAEYCDETFRFTEKRIDSSTSLRVIRSARKNTEMKKSKP